MCWIACIYGRVADKEQLLKQSLSTIIHRGSSVFEYKVFEHIALWANRLPIQWRDHGTQPLSNEDHTIWAIQNGEIFNYDDMRGKLEELWHNFSSQCDTELLCHLYEEYGVDAVNYLDSEMFAFVIYDAVHNAIYAGRDPLWVKPLFYAYHADGSIHFASEMKQLVQFDDITTVYNFPKGHYYFNGEFVAYKTFSLHDSHITFQEAHNGLTELLIAAVKKRVQTDLPIGVFLSGGVDSSVVMEIAHRLHPHVTALIVGQPGASDYDHAVRLCKAYGYTYQTISSHIPTLEEIANIAYYTESYEPLINRISISNDFASKLAQQLWLHVVLCWEWADELFGWYNEFSALDDTIVNKWSLLLTDGLERGHLLRVDRLAMKHTIEVRSPFLDTAIVDFALSLPWSYKIYKENHNIITKYLLRKVAAQFLPEYIVRRYKVPFHTGAGIDVGYNYKRDQRNDDVFAQHITKSPNKATRQEHQLDTKEEEWNFTIYSSYAYDKLAWDEQRIIVKDTLKTINASAKTSFLVAEFDFIPLYFPLYYAQRMGIFSQHGLDVEFISTKGDDTTHASICNNSADIGLSDPLFSMMTVGQPIHSHIFAQVVTWTPVAAVSFNPKVSIATVGDFTNYTIWSYQRYSTTHTFACYVTNQEVISLSNNVFQLSHALSTGMIDIAIVLLEDAYELEALWWHLVYNFVHDHTHFLYTGLTTTNLLSVAQQSKLKSFVVSIKESIKHITRQREQAMTIAKELFPTHLALEQTITSYLSSWNNDLMLHQYDAQHSYQMRKTSYPVLMKKFNGSFFVPDTTQSIITSLCSKKFMRDYPFMEDALYELIRRSSTNNAALHLVWFRGIGGKPHTDASDRSTLSFFHQFCNHIRTYYPPWASATFIISDMHALVNEFVGFDDYVSDVIQLLEDYGYDHLLLSSLYDQHQKSLDDVETVSPTAWASVSIRQKLENQAVSHFQWKNVVWWAQRYYAARCLEKNMIEQSYPNSIFFAHSASDMQVIYPFLPTFYLRSSKSKQSKVPWFSFSNNDSLLLYDQNE